MELDDVDVIVGQRIVVPEMLAIWRRIRAWAPLVHELDDDLFHVDSRNVRAAQLYSHQSVRDALRHSTWMADLVTVSTEPLAQVMIDECGIDSDKVVIIPNRVSAVLFEIERIRQEHIIIGWAGGGSHDRDFEAVHKPLRSVLDKNPRVKFHTLGHAFGRLVKRPNQVIQTRWIDGVENYWRAIDFDIALAPLAHTMFNSSKSALRAIEMGALGIPVIASDEPPYREVIAHGETGFLVDHAASWQWVKYMRALINDAEMREQMGKAARERVKARWSIADGYTDWERAYRRVAKGAT